MAHLLIVDDEPSICWGLEKLAGEMGHSAATAGSAEQGLVEAQRLTPDVVILDVRLPGVDGLTAMGQFRELLGSVPVVVITAYGDLDTAVEAVRLGAFEYLVKPFDLTLAERTIERALAARAEPAASPAAASIAAEEQLVGRSTAMQEVFKQIALVAPLQSCVHLRGESGTGKELVARAIHRYSGRAEGPFVPVNPAALSPALVESELFGHVRGAFTGAEQPRRGLLQQGDGGTVFLDEVGEIPAALQVKLLRALEHGEIWPVGAEQPLRADFRLISATHRDLRSLVAAGEFRHDLYFRLITFEIELPPLRERIDDIAPLAEFFLQTLSARNKLPRPTLSSAALAELEGRRWYGNVRELQNAVEHALIVARRGEIGPQHLPAAAPAPAELQQRDEASLLESQLRVWAEARLSEKAQSGNLLAEYLALVEPPLIRAVLAASQGQVAAAARRLGLHRTTLKKKMDEYGL